MKSVLIFALISMAVLYSVNTATGEPKGWVPDEWYPGSVIIQTSTTSIVAADPDTRVVYIKNKDSFYTVKIVTGNVSFASTDGYPLAPGESITIATQGDIYGISETTAPVGFIRTE